jgi:putative transposase
VKVVGDNTNNGGKMDYVHNNPVQQKWQLCVLPEEYYYSSALFYYTGVDNWGFLSHYPG